MKPINEKTMKAFFYLDRLPNILSREPLMANAIFVESKQPRLITIACIIYINARTHSNRLVMVNRIPYLATVKPRPM